MLGSKDRKRFASDAMSLAVNWSSTVTASSPASSRRFIVIGLRSPFDAARSTAFSMKSCWREMRERSDAGSSFHSPSSKYSKWRERT